jgi:hypothetical protein
MNTTAEASINLTNVDILNIARALPNIGLLDDY